MERFQGRSKLFIVSVICLVILGLSLVSVYAADQRNSMKGEVSQSEAYVQTAEAGGSDPVYFTIHVKIKRTGSYTVIAGFYKGACWHKGWFSGTEFYGYATVSGEEGDVLTVHIQAPEPPMNTNKTAGVFYSIDSICTQG